MKMSCTTTCSSLAARFTPEARQVPDTDWHLERLDDFSDELGASVLVATHSRYVVDFNRPPDNQNLYPGQDTTGLCPVAITSCCKEYYCSAFLGA